MKTKYLFSLLAIASLFVSCSDDDDDALPTITSVLVVNEGNFLSANGSISGYDIEAMTANAAVYEAGATVQNLRVLDDKYFLVGNAPDKLEILTTDFTVELSVTEGLDNPIDVASNGSRAYVTNWGDISTAFGAEPDSYVAIIDLSAGSVTDSILLDHRPQDIVLANNQLFVAHEAASVMTVIDLNTLESTTITTPAGSSEMVLDGEGDIWVLCTSGTLIEIDPRENSVSTSLTDLVVSGFNEKMAIDNSSETIYFLGGGNDSFTGLTNVFAVDLSASALSAEVLISDGFAFYGIGVNEETGDIYVGDSNAFQSTGTGLRYGSDGTLLADFATGIGPSGFLFAR